MRVAISATVRTIHSEAKEPEVSSADWKRVQLRQFRLYDGILAYLMPNELLAMQFVSKLFYIEAVPRVIGTVCIMPGALVRRKVSKMLASTPIGAHPKALALWKLMRPPSIDLLGNCIAMASGEATPLDFDSTVFAEWLTGMLHAETRQPHGVVREVQSGGCIVEQVFSNGVASGLGRQASEDECQIFVKKGQEILA